MEICASKLLTAYSLQQKIEAKCITIKQSRDVQTNRMVFRHLHPAPVPARHQASLQASLRLHPQSFQAHSRPCKCQPKHVAKSHAVY